MSNIFNGKRRFNGRQGEQIYNEELFALYEILKHYLDEPLNPDPSLGPQSDLAKPGALWLDRQTNGGYAHLMYRDSDNIWKPLYDDWFKITKDIRTMDNEPENAVEGQLWINDSGVLHWYNGSMFVPIKSRIADSTDLNASAFENFLVIDPLKMSGDRVVDNISNLVRIADGIKKWTPRTTYKINDIVYYTYGMDDTRFYIYENRNNNWTGNTHTSADTIELDLATGRMFEVELKTQYLIPSEALDKIFIDGEYMRLNDDYEKASDVCIQILLKVHNGKTVAAIHVNPAALKNIKKKIIKINKNVQSNDYLKVKVGPDNTEYYGVKSGLGTMLIKGSDYYTEPDGIKITQSCANKYELIYCMTYEFNMVVKNPGKLNKNTVELSNQTGIYIGQIPVAHKLVVFTQGLYLEDHFYEYTYGDPSGLVKFGGWDKDGKVTLVADEIVKPLFESRTDVMILRVLRKTGSVMIMGDMINSSNQLEINVPPGYMNPIVLVHGLNVSYMADNTINNGKIIVPNVKVGEYYNIIDMQKLDGSVTSKIVEGVVGPSSTISLEGKGLPINNGEDKALTWIDGFLVSSRDLDVSVLDTISIYGLTPTQTYLVYGDPVGEENRLLFDGEVAFSTIALADNFDDAVLYVNRNLIVDGGASYTTTELGDGIAHGEIKLIRTPGGADVWKEYDYTNKTWAVVDSDELKTELYAASSGYSLDSNVINILQNFGKVKCTYYAYKFADNIEKPLIKGYTAICTPYGTNELFYRIDSRHSYSLGLNALSVWINGVKQTIKEHYETTSDGRYYYGFIIKDPGEPVYPTCYYVIEEPETGEYMSCRKEFLTNKVGVSTYTTSNIILTPGVPRVFIDGYRQPMNLTSIENINTVSLKEPVVDDTITVINKFGKPVVVTGLEDPSSVLIEIRQDYRLREKTVVLTQENIRYIIQGSMAVFDATTYFAENVTLPRELFGALTSEINIYINGANYGLDFIKSKSSDSIVLTRIETIKMLAVGDAITFEWR